jgi:predicted dehydrogenase
LEEFIMDRKIRIGIIGVGQIGKVHLGRYQKINEELSDKVGGVEIVALADIDHAEADRVGKVFNIPNVYYNAWDMLKRDDLDAIDVCMHNNLHNPGTIAALESGRHVFCEKPMAGAYRDALAMYQRSKELGLNLSIQIATLFSKETKAARLLIDEGMLGHIYHARSTGFRRRGRPYVDGYGKMAFVQKPVSSGGAMYDMGVYHVANMLYLLGNPQVLRISGKTYQEMDMDAERRQKSGYSVEELGLGFVRFADGLSMDIIESWAINLDNFEGCSLAGSKGGLRLEPFGLFQSVGDLDLNTTADLDDFERRMFDLRATACAYDSPQAHWVAVLHGKVPLLPTAELALNTMLISEGIYLSERLGREVTAEEVLENSKSLVLPL